MTETTTSTSQRIIERSCALLDARRADLIFADLTELCPWVQTGELIWVRVRDFRGLIFWAVAGQEPVLLTQSLPNLTRLIVAHVGRLDGLEAEDLAIAVRTLTGDPRGHVLTPQFRTELVGPWPRWWIPDNDAALTERLYHYCRGPELLRSNEDATWSLRFHYLTPAGSVEAWMVSGESLRFTRTRSEAAEKAGTYLWPYY